VGAAIAAVLMLAVAYVAHAIPVAWTLGIAVYTWIARRVRPRDRVVLTFVGVAALFALRRFIMAHFAHRWSLLQGIGLIDTDQTILFGPKYFPIAAALFLIGIYLFVQRMENKGALRAVFEIPFQLCLLSSAVIVLLPGALMLPGFNHALDYINDRMSLVAALAFCGVIANVRPSRWLASAVALTAVSYFALVFVDERAQNRVEDRIEQAVAQLPPGSHVINGLCDSGSRIHPWAHNLDRVCIGKCWSWGNYEPASGAFRVRVSGSNEVVVADSLDAEEIEGGKYVIRKSDPPLYQVFLRGDRLDVRLLKPGTTAAGTCLDSSAGIR
jgi:hypothetical protein